MDNNLPFGFDKPEDSPGFLLWQTTMLWQRKINKALLMYEISHAQFVIMATLMWSTAHHKDITQTFMIHQTKLDKMTVSQSLKKLVSLGYVERNEHPIDTRAKKIALTPKGEELVKILVPIIEKIDEGFFGHLRKSTHQQFLQILTSIVRWQEEHP